ncbi:hypothetical protein FH581_002650 [Leptospira weilii]|uniref:hypothetical protein n=1 Tax=Leptospira weilii TaxID=28184 RepID=UPI0012DA2E45|nr:hypothetical protein [Leptospira weilii]UPY77781.1 hypothetical protein FH581_002650 [Leptospira weilii]
MKDNSIRIERIIVYGKHILCQKGLVREIYFMTLLLFGASLGGGSTQTSIRVLNDSDFNFKNVQVADKNFGDIAAHQHSDYKSFEIAYRYNYVKLFIKDQEFVIQPKDYVGETPLGMGKFTYLLRVTDFEKRRLDINYRADKKSNSR